MPANDIGIDLGTTNSLVYSTGRGLVLSEPSVVVYDKDTEKIKAIGEEARQMAGHVTSNMEVICPIRYGKNVKIFYRQGDGAAGVPQTTDQRVCAEWYHGDRT